MVGNGPSAWQIQQAFASLHSAMQRLSASENPDDQELSREMSEANADIMHHLHRAIRAAIESDSMADAAKSRIRDLEERANRFKRRSADLRSLAFSVMDALGMKKIVDAEYTVSIRAGAPRALILDEQKIPDEYWKIEKRIDTAKLNADVKVGVVVPGVELTNGMPSVAIRTK